MAQHARELGLIVRPIGGVVIIMPAPSITMDEIDEAMGMFIKAFELASETWAQIQPPADMIDGVESSAGGV